VIPLLSREDVAELIMTCDDVKERMTARRVYSRKADGTLPLGTMTCGELIAMSRGLMLLVWQQYPELADPAEVEQLIRSAAVRGAGGAMN